jgi:hypothetical protein
MVAGCQGVPDGENDTVQQKLHGIFVAPQKTDVKTIFLGYRQDLQQEFSEVLAGKQTNEKWYIVEVASSLMPTKSSMAKLNLADNAGIKITMRRPFYHPGPTDTKAWFTHAYSSKAEGVKGTLEISGSDVVANAKGLEKDSNNKWGVAFHIEYRGPLSIFGHTIKNAGFTRVVGGLVENRISQ